MVELLLEEGKPALKVPRAKLDPHLSKYRAETDRLRSEYDKNAKELTGRSAKLEAVLKAAKEDTDGALRELGIDPDAYAEAKLAAKVRAAMRDAEEKEHPEKKTARERDEEREQLRKENEELKKSQQQREREQGMNRLRAAITATVAKLPEALREGATPVVISVFRQAIADGKDITMEDAAKAARSVLIARAKAAYEADEDLRKLLGGAPAPAAAAAAAKPAEEPHPAAKPAPRGGDGKFKKPNPADAAGDVLQRMMAGKF
jgi:hypothetical protein